jgi:ribosomal protein L23
MRINKTLIKPVVTEKAVALHDSEGKFTMEVDLWATKKDIKNSMRDVFDVEIYDIRMLVSPGKRRRLARTPRFVTTPMKKKAIFKLKDGKLDFYQGS